MGRAPENTEAPELFNDDKLSRRRRDSVQAKEDSSRHRKRKRRKYESDSDSDTSDSDSDVSSASSSDSDSSERKKRSKRAKSRKSSSSSSSKKPKKDKKKKRKKKKSKVCICRAATRIDYPEEATTLTGSWLDRVSISACICCSCNGPLGQGYRHLRRYIPLENCWLVAAAAVAGLAGAEIQGQGAARFWASAAVKVHG